jgi:hypothetical protein
LVFILYFRKKGKNLRIQGWLGWKKPPTPGFGGLSGPTKPGFLVYQDGASQPHKFFAFAFCFGSEQRWKTIIHHRPKPN